jgi:YVTN family beta-propeller protein
MKRIKYVLLIGVFLLLVYEISIFIIRRPSYTIQTNGKLYIVNKLSSSITVFDLFAGKELTEIPIAIEPNEATALTNSNRVVVTNYGSASAVGRSISVINTKSNKVEKTIDLGQSLRPHGIITFPHTKNVGVVTNIGNDLLVVNVETGIVEKKISTQQVISHLLVLHPNKPIAYVTNVNSNSVSVIDLSINQVIKIIPCGLGTEGIDITPDGTEIWVTNNKENSISVINTDTYQITNTMSTGKESLRLKFSVNGKYCLVPNSGDGTISVYNRYSKKQIKTIRISGKINLVERALYHTPRPVGILMHPNGLFAFVTNSNANKIEVIDMNTFALVSTIGTGKVPDGLTLVE